MPLTPLERKAQMVLKQISQTDLAEELGVTQPHVSQVISGERRSPRVEEAIAAKLGMPVEVVFGSDVAAA